MNINNNLIKKNKIKFNGEKQNKFTFFFKFFIVFILSNLFFTSKIRLLNIHNEINKYSSHHGRIFLCTLYNNEAEIAYIHFWRLYNYVDKFIIVISNITNSGVPKNFSFKSFEKDIHPFRNKIDIVEFNNICNKKEYPTLNFFWCIEHSQRDYAKIYIEEKYNPTEEDLLIVVDMDEILTREGIAYLKKNQPKNFAFIKGSKYFPYYYHKVDDWDKGYVVRYNKNMTTLTNYRMSTMNESNLLKYKSNPLKPLITHCSFCFKDIEEYRNKIKSFAHQEYNKYPYITNNWIFRNHYCRIKISSLPGTPGGYDEPYEGWKHLIPNDKRLKYLFDRSFMYPINLTTFTKKDLKKICNRIFNRTPFEISMKYY